MPETCETSLSRLISCLCLDKQWCLEITDAHTYQFRHLSSVHAFLDAYSFLLIRQFEVKLPEKCTHKLVNVCCRHSLAYTLTSPQPEVHEEARFCRYFGAIPPFRVEDIMIRAPHVGIVMKSMIAYGHRGLEMNALVNGLRIVDDAAKFRVSNGEDRLTPCGMCSPAITIPSEDMTRLASGMVKTGVTRKFSLTQFFR